MAWWHAALWALAGGFVVEGLEFAALQRRHRKWPWQVDAEAAAVTNGTAAGPLGYFVGEVLRLAAGGVLGAALAGQVTGPLPALAIGAAAPVIAGHLVAYVPLPAVPSPADAAATVTPTPTVRASPDNNGSIPAQPAQRQSLPALTPEPLPDREETT